MTTRQFVPGPVAPGRTTAKARTATLCSRFGSRYRRASVSSVCAVAVFGLCIWVCQRALHLAWLSPAMIYLNVFDVFHLVLVAPWSLGVHSPPPGWLVKFNITPALLLVIIALLGYQAGAYLSVSRGRAPASGPNRRMLRSNPVLFHFGLIIAGVGFGLFIWGVRSIGIQRFLQASYIDTFRLVREHDPRLFVSSLTVAPIGLYLAVACRSYRVGQAPGGGRRDGRQPGAAGAYAATDGKRVLSLGPNVLIGPAAGRIKLLTRVARRNVHPSRRPAADALGNAARRAVEVQPLRGHRVLRGGGAICQFRMGRRTRLLLTAGHGPGVGGSLRRLTANPADDVGHGVGSTATHDLRGVRRLLPTGYLGAAASHRLPRHRGFASSHAASCASTAIPSRPLTRLPPSSSRTVKVAVSSPMFLT